MPRVISIVSGKGGVGKTTAAINIAAALQKLGRSVIVADFNLTTPHVGLYMDSFAPRITLNDVLRNAARIDEAIITHASGIRFIPSSIGLSGITGVSARDMRSELASLTADFIFLDAAPGLGREALMAMQSSDEMLLVANPHLPSLVDAAKCMQVGSARPVGIVLNRVKGRRYELTGDHVAGFTGLPVLGVVPEDDAVLECLNRRQVAVHAKERSRAATAFMATAAKLAGIEYKPRRFWLW